MSEPQLVVNRINTWGYDSSGNVTNIPLIGSAYRGFAYDGENRQASATIFDGTNTTNSTYTYDGNGQRISKTANGQTTTYVYDAFGNLAAEYGSSEPSAFLTATCYVTVDHLGSTRMVTDSNGVVQRRYDYQPFGADIPASYDGRTPAMGYIPDDLNPKYTGKQRDPETGLDWFEVRHMSGGQGRFQSVDPGNAGAALENPQTWNAYAYTGNNPLSYTDPSGECWWCTLIGVGLDIAGFFTGGTTTVLGSILISAGTVAAGGSIGGGIIGDIVGSSNTGPWNEQIPSLGNSGLDQFGITNFTDRVGDISLGSGWTGALDQFAGGQGFEIHVFNAQGKEAGVLSGRLGWIG